MMAKSENIKDQVLTSLGNNTCTDHEGMCGQEEKHLIANLEERLNIASEDEYAQIAGELSLVGRKVISVAALTDSNRVKVEEVLLLLKELKKEVALKKEEALAKSSVIKNKVYGLVSSGKVQIQEDEYLKSDESVRQYAGLLNNIVLEIEGEENAFLKALKGDLGKYIIVYVQDTEDFNDYIDSKVNFIRKYAKNIKKDLNVSFSRYSFGFEAQMKRILHVEHFIRLQDAQNVSNDVPPVDSQKES